ncbi:MAG: PEGA domain-containing protein [Patescibacteria group bacterium]
MTIFHRRLIYSIFIGIFLIAAPLIVLYTMGYRYNLTKGRVQKTGIIRITSTPRGADIQLNGIKYELSQTPARIEKLLPGDYEIKLSKDGYYDWQKKLPVYENGTTFAEKIILWKKSEPANLSSTTAASWLVSPDKNIVAVSDGRATIELLDINSGILGELSGGNLEIIATIPGSDSLRLLSFSPSGRYLLAQGIANKKNNYYLIDSLAKNYKKFPSQDYLNVRWGDSPWANDSDNLYALDQSGLWNIDFTSLQPAKKITAITADDFYIFDKIAYYLNDSTLLEPYSNENRPIKLDCSACRFKNIENNRAIVTDGAGKILIIDLNRQIKTIELTAKDIDWLNPNSLIAYNDYEIYIYETTKNSPELITRLSSPILSASWHPDGRYLVFSAENKLKIIELDNRERRNTVDIAEAAASFITVDRAGNNLYYAVDKLGIFKLNIQ